MCFWMQCESGKRAGSWASKIGSIFGGGGDRNFVHDIHIYRFNGTRVPQRHQLCLHRRRRRRRRRL